MERRDVEIMAPVGSYESLMAAIQGGAGSVYFGVENLNMRSRSSNNFNLDDLRKIVRIATENKVKTYLTMNVEIFDGELDKMNEVIDAAKEAGVSAVIAADVSVIQYARSVNLEVHISTQVNITNIEAVKFYSNFADVVVLAREMNLGRVWEISDQIKKQNITGPNGELMKIEMFVHGALCMATSGKCYLSLHEMNSSANRGACLQTCRRAYTVTDKETGAELEIDNEYIMSPKDLKTIHFLNKILDAGVSVLKIEGRARSAEYVKTVAQCYREAVDAYFDESFTDEKVEDWNNRLETVFNRGFWDGYYLGKRLGEWSKNYGSRASKRKLYIGKCTNYFKKIGVAEFKLETNNLKEGDEIIVTGPTTGVYQNTVSEIRFDLKPVEEGLKGQRISVPIDEVIRRADKLYKLVDASQVKERR
ncbi:peptidase U32 family protein [uncultured Draconibacterium sp.]|uniref:peptidase U32 family protein n=1 Tax=uncultured Draconibacterium sp. TaxID=1573823 RepID=UPI0029C811B0|nr:peptidase U32 family protein [uncultured Draconibacterium sp.]